jgi:hypothetical protein
MADPKVTTPVTSLTYSSSITTSNVPLPGTMQSIDNSIMPASAPMSIDNNPPTNTSIIQSQITDVKTVASSNNPNSSSSNYNLMSTTDTSTQSPQANSMPMPMPMTRVASVSNSTTTEGGHEIFIVKLADICAEPIAVQLNLNSGTAILGADFQTIETSIDGGKTWNLLSNGNVLIPGNISDFQVRVETIDDTNVELTETFTLTASANGTQVTGTGTILDNDNPKIVSVSDANATEGQKAVFTVGLSDTTVVPTTIQLALSDGTATSGADFAPDLEASFDGGTTWNSVPANGQLAVGTGVRDFQVRTQALTDNLIEGNETFKLAASANGVCIIGTGTIIDDKPPIAAKVISVSNASAIEGFEEVFTVGLSDTTVAPTTIQLTLASGTATLGADFALDLEASFDGGKTWNPVPANGQLAVGAGVKDFQVRTITLTDNLLEGNETFNLTAAGNGGTANGIGTIINGSSVPPIVISVSDTSAIEGDKEVFTVTLSKNSTVGTVATVQLNLVGDTASKGLDFDSDLEASFDGGKTWNPVPANGQPVSSGVKDFLVRIPTRTDNLIEGNETFKLFAGAELGIGVFGTATIIDKPPVAPKVISVSDASAIEGDKEVFTVGLSDTTVIPTTVQLTLANGTATSGADFAPDLEASFDGGKTWSGVPANGQLAVGAGIKDFQVRTMALTDNLVEGNETFNLTAAGNGGTVTGTGTIIDKPPVAPKVISISDASAIEGDKEVFTVGLSDTTVIPTTVQLTLANGTATSGADFAPDLEASFDGGKTWSGVPANGQLAVGAGVKDFQVRTMALTDNLVEGNETFKLTAAGNGGTVTGTGTIIDKPPVAPKVISVSDASAIEGDKEVFTVGLSDTTVIPTTIQLTLANGTATTGADFSPDLEASFDGGKTWSAVPANGQLAVGAGVKDFQVRTMALTDNLVEGNETFKLTAAGNGGTVTGTGTIIDKPPVAPKVISVSDASAIEGDKEVFTVGLSDTTVIPTTVQLTLANGTATSGADFAPDLEASFDGGKTWSAVPANGQLAVSAGVKDFQVRTMALTDNLVEGNETFNLTAAGNGGTVTGTGTIIDKPPVAPKVISISDASTIEGDKEVFTVGLSDTTVIPTTVQLTLANGTATTGADFSPDLEASFDGGKTWSGVPANGQLAVGAGVKDFQVRTMALTDNLVEGNETFKLTAAGNGGTVTGTGTIIDKPPVIAPKVIAIRDAKACEGDKEVFTVGLSGVTTAPTTVQLNLASGTAILGQDFSPDLEASFDGGKTWSGVPANGQLAVGAGIKDFQVRTMALTDNLVEGNETFKLTAAGNGGTVTGTGTILDKAPIATGAVIVGGTSIDGGQKGCYSIKVDGISNKDRFFTIQIDDGKAKRFDGNGFGQDYTWGGKYDTAPGYYTSTDPNNVKFVRTGPTIAVYKDLVANGLYASQGNRAAVGAADGSQDYTVYNSQGQINQGNTITVKVGAGKTSSDQFAVQTWQNKVTVDQDYRNPNGLDYTNYREGDENFSLKLVSGGGVPIANNSPLNVTIKDTNQYRFVSPIAIDLNGDGVQSLSINKGVKFDMLNTGEKVSTGWISSADGLLAIDTNGNGKIDNRAELFGGGVGDGFAKLGSFDSNRDGFVTANDVDFGKLKVWQDKNSNGITDANELFSLADVGIASLKVAHTSNFTLDAQQNILGESSVATTNNGKNLDMVDVYFQIATTTPNLFTTHG